MYNEILPPVIEKQKILEANEQSLYQLLDLFFKKMIINQNRIVVLQSLMELYFQKKLLCSVSSI